MNTKEAMQALIDGKKVRGRGWRSPSYIHLVDGAFYGDRGRTDVVFSTEDDWELYEEPEFNKRTSNFEYTYSSIKEAEELREKLRWKKWPSEKPSRMGNILCRVATYGSAKWDYVCPYGGETFRYNGIDITDQVLEWREIE